MLQSPEVFVPESRGFLGVPEFRGYERMAFITVPSLLGQALRPNGNDSGKDLDQVGICYIRRPVHMAGL